MLCFVNEHISFVRHLQDVDNKILVVSSVNDCINVQ